MNVLFITAEMAPLAKVGGLADVAGALPKALKQLGVDIRVVMPKYASIDTSQYPLQHVADGITIPFKGTTEVVSLYATTIPGSDVPVYLIEHPGYLSTHAIYFEDIERQDKTQLEAERFLFFSRASLAIPASTGWYPDIIHCQDWHVGLVPILRDILGKKDARLARAKTLLTIHNLEYQGWYQKQTVFDLLGLTPSDHPALRDTPRDQIISLRHGILTADYLNTVSETYAHEILTPEFGAHLEHDLHNRQRQLRGIVNGIDTERFDPETDTAIAATYTAAHPENKKQCKTALQKLCDLPTDTEAPLLGIVSRLAQQKGIDLLVDIIDDIAESGAQLVVLGTGLPDIEQAVQAAAKRNPASVSAQIGFDGTLARRIYAGCDFFLMPSRYEPCGLGQMIAMRYGTVPVVRATGGLKDTVHEITVNGAAGEGFVFDEYSAPQFLQAIQRGLGLYQNEKAWHTVISRIMRLDFSWDASARQYYQLYQTLKP
ncbi:MAG: glycogen synthase [Patescibacteria group bacterium]